MWEIIDYNEKHFDEMVDMTREYYGEENDISNGDFVSHEYFNNPSGKAYIKLAYDFENATIAGQYMVLPKEYKINKQIYKAVLSLNTLTRESYRGQQVFTKLAEAVYGSCKQEGIKFCYGAPNQNSFPGFMKKLSFKNMGEMPLYLKVQNPAKIIFDKMKLSKRRVFKNVSILQNEDIQIEKITYDNLDIFDELWGNIQNKYKVIGVRNSEYIKWRYFDLPRRDYYIFLAIKDNNPIGYVIGRISEVSGIACGMIVDFLFSKGELSAGDLLLRQICKLFKTNNIGLLGCLMQNNKEEAELLRKHGFFRCPHFLLPQPFPIIYRKFISLEDEDDLTVEDFSNWFFTMGDYDVI